MSLQVNDNDKDNDNIECLKSPDHLIKSLEGSDNLTNSASLRTYEGNTSQFNKDTFLFLPFRKMAGGVRNRLVTRGDVIEIRDLKENPGKQAVT